MLTKFSAMNPLEQYPHLFANGQFSVEWPTNDLATDIYGFEAHFVLRNSKVGGAFLLSDGDVVPVEQLTLIARPIEDMTDEELQGLPTFDDLIDAVTDYYKDRMRNSLSKKADDGLLPFVNAIYMIDRGIYPGPQYHFDDGTVLNVKQIVD